jgi:serine phosphatase RsbU (regulator of sigma subunit)
LKTHLLYYLLLLVGFLSLNGISQTPRYGAKEFYLIDSLDLNVMTVDDKHYVDSCLNTYHKATNDTMRVTALIGIVNNVWNDAVWPVYNRYIMNRILASAPRNLQIQEINFMKRMLAETINNEGFYYRNIGNIPVALEYYHKSLKLLEELHDSIGMSFLYNNLGAIYQHQASYEMSIRYHQKSLELKIALGDSAGMAHSYNNLGVVYQRFDSLEKAMEYFHKGQELYLKYNDVRGWSRGYYNLAFGYGEIDSFERAKIFYEKSLAGYASYGDEEGISMTSSGLGALAFKMGDYGAAKEYAETGLKYAQQLGHPDLINSNASVLYAIAKSTGDYKVALEMRNLEIQMRDSLANTDYIKQSADAEAKYQFEKEQAIRDTEHRVEIEKQQSVSAAEKKRQNTVIISVSIGLLLVLLFSVFLNNRIRITRKQKKIIEAQKHEVEEKNKEILDSIRYAKRIQNAILPSMEAMQNELKKGFVLYKPKDVVAGDFYWMEKIEARVYVAAADCTGHGVPGAMVSVVCSNALSKALLEESADSTGDLLDKTREIVIKRLAKSGEEMKDGMDISLCVIDFEKMELQWSGANNPLWIVRENELIEYKADKQPVGVHSAMKNFTTHQIQLFRGDKIYLMTDGFQDQFGGANGKKFKAAQLKEIILQSKNEDMNEQKIKLENAFENWKKGFEQIDDVCLIGVEI